MENGTENEANAPVVQPGVRQRRLGLAPTRRIYRNYAWVIALACLMAGLWVWYTYDGYLSYKQKDYFDEYGTIERFGVSMMLAEQSEDLPAIERWLLGVAEKEEARREAAKYLDYANEKQLLTDDGRTTLACIHWSLGNEQKANEIMKRVSASNSLYSEALKELLAGRELDDYSWGVLADELRAAPRDWTACFLAEKAGELSSSDHAEEVLGLVDERKQLLLVTSAKIAILDWLVTLAGLVCLIVLVRKKRQQGKLIHGNVPRLPHLWPLAFVLVVFCLGDFVADLVSTIAWNDITLSLTGEAFTAYQIIVDVLFRGTGTVLFLWFFFRYPNYVRRTLLRPVPYMWQWVMAAFTVVWLIDIAWYALPSDWFPLDETVGFQWNEYGWSGLATSVVSGVILAPVFEEFIFRGLLFNGIKNRLGVHASAVISAIVFSAVHFYGIQDMIAVGFFGLVMAYLYYLTRSLWPCILCHALMNLVITIWEWIMVQSPEELWSLG